MQTHPWLVFDEKGVKGYAYASQFRTRAAYRWAADVSVYVAPSHHGRGVGRQLYSALLARLKDQGFYVACATIALPNDASIALHRKMGFQPVGVYTNIGWKFGGWHDVSGWQLQLNPPSDSPPAEPAPALATRPAPD